MKKKVVADLGQTDIGKTVEYTYQHGQVTSTIKDTLIRVTHYASGTQMYFDKTRWPQQGVFIGSADEGLFAPPNAYILVEEGSE